MKADKELAISYFMSKSIDVKHFPKQKAGKKLDFELYLEKRLFGFCELESIVDYEFIGFRHDPTYNKIQLFSNRITHLRSYRIESCRSPCLCK